MSKRKDMLEALATSMTREMVPFLIEWIRDPNRKEAIHAFTEGPVRQVAYAVEYALKLERETTPVLPPLTMRPTERCPRCGFVQYVPETLADRQSAWEKFKPTATDNFTSFVAGWLVRSQHNPHEADDTPRTPR